MKNIILIVSTLISLITPRQVSSQAKELPIANQKLPADLFQKYNDSIVFTLPQYPPLSADGPAFVPDRYSIQLPVKLRDYWENMPSYILFNYHEGQNLVIRKNHLYKVDPADSSFIPDRKYLDFFIPLIGYTKEPASMMPVKDRITKVITKGGTELLLLNIKKENYTKFLQAVNTFRVLPHGN